MNGSRTNDRSKRFLRRPVWVLGTMAWVVLAGTARHAIPIAAAQDASEQERPNIILILIDDQGYYDLGCYGATELETPVIDSLAENGVRFTDYYAAAPICSPSRAGLLTGCYPRRVGMATWVLRADASKGIHPDELTLPELLASHGYATACIGKWHLGFQEPYLPRAQGFIHYFGLLHNLDPVETIYFQDAGGVPLMRNDEVVKRPVDPAELTAAYTDEAIRFIERHRDEPFFLYLPHTMAHVPMGVSEPFQGTSRLGLYGDVIHCLDYHIGRIVETLERLEIADQSIIVYASDNGRGPGRTEAQPMRGFKLTTWECGIRVPCIAWAPGLGWQQAATSSEVVSAMDWFPTLATAAGIEVPPGPVLDGRDISPLLSGSTMRVPAAARNRALNGRVPLRRTWQPPLEWAEVVTREEYGRAFFYHGSHGALAAVRWEQWKLHLHPGLQLYDLANDPGERTPVRRRDVLRKLRGMAVLFQEEMRRDARPAGELRLDARRGVQGR